MDTPGGKDKFLLDVDDNLGEDYYPTRICREDLADLCVAALSVGKGQSVSFDCITWSTDGAKPQTAEQALTEFMDRSKTANYAQ